MASFSNLTPTFPSEIFSWLISQNFECNLFKENGDIFETLQVQKSEFLLLEVKLIEVNKWQSEPAYDEWGRYLTRQLNLRSAQIRTVILWEDLWIFKRNIVESRLRAILGRSQRIPARLTYPKRIDKATASSFLTANHLQDSVLCKYRFGLYLPVKYFRILSADFQLFNKNEDFLVAVATFSQPRIFSKNDEAFRSYELIRFANLLNTTVVGGLDKLLNAFIKEISPDDIMTYVDLDWSDGKNYQRLGFEQISQKPPIAFLLDTKTNERFSYQRHAHSANLIDICNSGSLKFVKTIKKVLPGI